MRRKIIIGAAVLVAVAGSATQADAARHAPARTTGQGAVVAGVQAAGAPGKWDEAGMRAYVQCMRDHGIDIEADIEDGRIQVRIQGADKATIDAAEQACGGGLPKDEPGPGALEKAWELVRCMREHGIAAFPDPQPDGGIRIDSDQGIDPMSPEFLAAQQACDGEPGTTEGKVTEKHGKPDKGKPGRPGESGKGKPDKPVLTHA
ncbi:hypothetical protein [Actinokineospora enzanensis]|uniref:hypothetical protein n=1 Tax=Actinokineospora enzanensis TaxID=155975 RepID=UPI0003661580|nr:hypothetical protein [Actinokineospora enzanensis]